MGNEVAKQVLKSQIEEIDLFGNCMQLFILKNCELSATQNATFLAPLPTDFRSREGSMKTLFS